MATGSLKTVHPRHGIIYHHQGKTFCIKGIQPFLDRPNGAIFDCIVERLQQEEQRIAEQQMIVDEQNSLCGHRNRPN
jgi:hypothetical protein